MTIEDPVPQATKKPFYKRWWFIAIAIILALILITIGWVVLSAKKEADAINAAVDECKEQVINHAKYPGGAEIVDWDVEILPKANSNRFINVTGEADFPNGFGTPVRIIWSCNNVMITKSGDVSEIDPLIIEKNR